MLLFSLGAQGIAERGTACKASSSGNLGHVSQTSVALVGQREAVQLKEGAGAR